MDSSAANDNGMTPAQRELELQRKRARDRKSQQAMRDRTKWTIQTLSEQVAVLTSALDQRSRDVATVEARIRLLESENAQIRAQNAALQLSLLGRNGGEADAGTVSDGISVGVHSPGSIASSPLPAPLWELYPKNTPPSCVADQIIQGFVDTVRSGAVITPSTSLEHAQRFPLRPNLCSLIDDEHRSNDDISNVVADVVRAYGEIEGRPKQVGVFYIMATLIKVRGPSLAPRG
jgi:hypothetical protein